MRRLRPFYADGDESRLGSLEAHLMKGARREAFELGRIKLRLIAADMRKIEIRGQLIERFGRDERRPTFLSERRRRQPPGIQSPRPATCRSRARRCASIIPRPTPWSTDYGGRTPVRRPPQSFEKLNLDGSIGDVIFAADDVADLEIEIIDDGRQRVEVGFILAHQHRIGERGRIDMAVAADKIIPADDGVIEQKTPMRLFVPALRAPPDLQLSTKARRGHKWRQPARLLAFAAALKAPRPFRSKDRAPSRPQFSPQLHRKARIAAIDGQ